MASTSKLASTFLGVYDKLVALVGVIVLGVAAFLFATGRAASEKDGKAFQRKISNLTPAHPDVADVSARVAAYAVPFSRIAKPLQISPERERKAGFFTPEMRVWCVRNDCRFPLAPEWNKCPICGTEQVVKPVETINADSDGDGMPDDWERKHGLNPQDPSDAALDSDEDGFTNLQEFQDGTDPLDAKSHRDLVTLLRVEKIEATILPLKFTGAQKMPDGYRCTFNYIGVNPATKRREPFTLWVKEGDSIGKAQGIETGFTLISLNEDAEEVENKSTGLKSKRPTVTISRGDQEFTLSQDKVANDTDYIITLANDFDDKGEIVLDRGRNWSFKVGDKVYHVVKADRETMKVVIRCDADKTEVTLTRDGASK